MDTVSIVIVSHNSREHLEACLASVFALDYPRENTQVIVVDNASSDVTVGWLAQGHPRVTCEASPENTGFAQGINRGAAVASGKYLAFLNPDMRVDVHWLSRLVETIRSEPDVACAGSVALNWAGDRIDYAGHAHDGLCLFPADPADSSTLPDPTRDIPLLFASGEAMLIRREVFQQLGGFDPDYFLYHEDVDFGWRLWSLGYRVLRASRSVVYHRQGSAAARIAPAIVAHWVDKHALYTVLKNLEEPELQRIFPRLAYCLVGRANTWELRHTSLAAALRDCIREADALWTKRASLRERRVRRDAAIFAECGHPFETLPHDPASAAFERYWEQHGLRGDCVDGPSLAQYLLSVGFHAYAYNSESLSAELAAQQQRVNSLVAHVGERQQAVDHLGAELAEQTARANALANREVSVADLRIARNFRRMLGGALLRLGVRTRASTGESVAPAVKRSGTREADP